MSRPRSARRSEYRQIRWVCGGMSALLAAGELAVRPGVPLLGGLALWFALVAALLTWPPRRAARRDGDGFLVRPGLLRRWGVPVLLGPFLVAMPLEILRERLASPWAWAALALLTGLDLALLWGTHVRHRVRPTGVERIPPWPGKPVFLPWHEVTGVHLGQWRGYTSSVVLESRRCCALSIPLLSDGIGDLAAALLAQRPDLPRFTQAAQDWLEDLAAGVPAQPS